MTLREQITTQGFAIVEGVLESSVTQGAIDEIEKYFEETRATERHALRHVTRVVPAIAALANSPPVRNLIGQILGTEAFLVHSLFFDKTPDANWKVAWHQDLMVAVESKVDEAGYGPWSLKDAVWHAQPPAVVLQGMLTMRLHLDNCFEESGPLRVLPGSHVDGVLTGAQIDECRQRIVPVTCSIARGGALLMRPLLLHSSSRAKAPGHRRVIHFEFASRDLPGEVRWLRD